MQASSTKRLKFVFTGGHHNSALSVAKEIMHRDLGEVVWFGHKFSMLGDTNVSAEYKEVTASKIRFRNLKAGKVYRTWNLIHLARLPLGFIQAFWYLLDEKPDLIVSFGGYLAAPVVIAGWLQGIPSVTHEQTTVVGLANQLIAHFARKIFVTWPQSKQYFPEDRVIVTGLPLRESILKPTKSSHPLFSEDLPIVYVTGGKQGSHVLNQALGLALPQLLKSMNIIHQTGSNTIYNDFDELTKKRQHLPKELRDRYQLHQYIYENEVGSILSQSDVVIARAGAHTVYELAALGKPALFVPIPWVSHNEQYKNARILVNEGSAVILPEDRLTPVTLEHEISRMLEQLEHYRAQAERAKSRIVLDAKERMVDELTKLVAAQKA